MPTDTKLQNLIINELTEEQYKALTPNENEFYLTPDTSGGGGESEEPVKFTTDDVTIPIALTDEQISQIIEKYNTNKGPFISITYNGMVEFLIHSYVTLHLENTLFGFQFLMSINFLGTQFFLVNVDLQDKKQIEFKEFAILTSDNASLFIRDGKIYLTNSYNDSNSIINASYSIDSINGKPILHKDSTINNYTIPTITFED